MVEIFSIATGLATSIGKSAINMFTGNFLGAFGSSNAVFILVLLGVFVLILRKAMSIAINFAIIAGISAAFPFLAGYLGFSIPTTPQTIVFFAVMGTASYVAFLVGKYILKLFGFLAKPAPVSKS